MKISRISPVALALGACLLAAPAAATPASAGDSTPAEVSRSLSSAHGAPQGAASHRQQESNGTLGTRLSFRNDTNQTVYIRYWETFNWSEGAAAIQPGQWFTHWNDRGGRDDVEIRIYSSSRDAKNNENYVEVDAENPAWGHPYLVVDWDEHAFNVNETYEYTRAYRGLATFWSKRYADSDHYKEFHLHMKTIW